MDMRNNKRRNVTKARVNFSQSETSLLMRGGELNFELLLWEGGINRKDPYIVFKATLEFSNQKLSFHERFRIFLSSFFCEFST